MIRGIVIDDKFQCNLPTSWKEVTFEQYFRLEIWRNSKDQDLLRALSILTDIPYKIWARSNCKDFETVILPNLTWLNNIPKIRRIRMKRSIDIMDKIIDIPMNAEYESLGQKVACDQKIHQYVNQYKDDSTRLGFYQMTYLIAAYISPKISGKDFDMEFTEVVQQEVMKQPALDMLPIGAFFLRKSVDSMLLRKAFRKSKEKYLSKGRILRGLKRLVSFVLGTPSPQETS